MIVVRGRTLTGLAAAARLARLGHEVVVAGPPVPHPRLLDFLELPATWRDLFKKSGRPLPGELIRLGAELVPAPPTTVRLPDGLELVLPDERGGQYYAIRDALGQPAAEAWRDLLDDLDEVWAAMRRFGVESPARPTTPADRRTLWLDRTIADVADRAGRLAPIVLAQARLAGTDSLRAPAVLAARLAIVRTFSRHRLVATDGAPLPATTLVDLLLRRLQERGVTFDDDAIGGHVLDCRPTLPRRLLRRPRPALAPSIAEAETGPAAEVLDLSGPAPLRTIRTPASAVTIDYAATLGDLSSGVAPDDAASYLLRTAPTATAASAASLAGPEPWAELSSAALAAYQLHEQLTGEDPRPTNKAFRLPRITRPRT